jgi:hypothetical protein
MLRNCAAILFVCFDMTALTHLVYLAAALDHKITSRKRRKPRHAKQIALNSAALIYCALK